MVQVTGFATDQWQSNARTLWQHGENVYLSGIAEDGSREEVKHLRSEDYVPNSPDIDAPDVPADTLEMGMTFDVDGHRFEIESIDLLYHEVRLKDLTFQQQNGFPVFRTENYDVVLQWVRDAAKSQENTVDTPVKMKEIVIDLRPREEREIPPEPPVERHNFRITDDDLGAGGPKAKFRANMDAIYLLKTLENENRLATPEEQEVLSRFVGWGGIPQAFDPDVREWSGEYAEVKAALTKEECEAARASTLNAFYTSPTVIRAMYDALNAMGFKKPFVQAHNDRTLVEFYIGLLETASQEMQIHLYLHDREAIAALHDRVNESEKPRASVWEKLEAKKQLVHNRHTEAPLANPQRAAI